MIKSLAIAAILITLSSNTLAEIYYYRTADGSLMISDHAIEDKAYSLTLKRDSLKDAGSILSSHSSRKTEDIPFRQHIYSASSQYGLDPTLVQAIIQVESSFNPNAVSSAGAGGLMQLMPETAAKYNVHNRFDPRQNIYGGAKHLKYLMEKYDDKINLVLAAYNAGSGAVDKYGDIPPFAETRRYVLKVKSALNRIRQQDLTSIN